MQDYELDAYLGGIEVTDDQRATLARAADLIAARFPDDSDSAGLALSLAAQVILGDNTLEGMAADYLRARRIERDLWTALIGAMIAAAASGMPEARIAETAGVARMTVRKALGK